MFIKPQTVIPPDVKITRVPPSIGKGRSIYSLYREAERKLEKQEANAHRLQRFKEALARGCSVAEAALCATSQDELSHK